MQQILINNGKLPGEPYNARLGFWLPPDTPYGNFSLKLMKLIQRLDEANRRIIESYNFWKQARVKGFIPINAHEGHVFANEQAVYLMRRACDEIIATVWCLFQWEINGEYPNKIKVDCIGSALNMKQDDMLEIFRDNINTLRVLNEISNAFKHSFVNSDHTLIGKDEPCVHALALNYNKLLSEPKFYNISLAQLVSGFNKFYQEAMGWLEIFSKKHR